MRMLNKLSLFTLLCALAVGFSACSSDDDEPSADAGTSSAFTINNIKAGKILNTLCEITEYPSWLGGGKELALQARFDYSDEGMMDLDMAVSGISSLSQLKKGMELSDDMAIYRFYSMFGAYVGHENYEVLSGKATVEKIGSSAVDVKFTNFTFLRELENDEETFTVNGTISYTIDD